MRRRTFVTGSLLAAAATAATLWRGRAWTAGAAPEGGERLPDGRFLVRGAALAFGTTVTIAAVHEDPAVARGAITEALGEARRVDALMSVYRKDSEVGRLNAEGVLHGPDPHLVRVLDRAQQVAELSGGAFDVTVQPLWTLFVACRGEGRLPAPREIASARALVGYRGLEVSRRRVALARPGMGITLNGIAQGYAADLALAALAGRGVRDALLDTGEFGAEGVRAPSRPWTVGVQHPRDGSALLGTVAMDGRFLATSGDYATTFSDDRLYHHIFDPATGVSPVGLSSVVVAASSGMDADALTKPLMILDRARAERLLAGFAGAGALWVDKEARVVGARGLALLPVASPSPPRSGGE
jgi:FAD:protein FMN transferase